jgi:hypothetical protein
LTKRASMYKSEKRKKELSRQKKREEKRQKRLEKGETQKQDSGVIAPAGEDKAAEESVS